MEFLPLEIDGQKVYTGFWRRFGALFVDALVFAPLIIIFYFFAGLSLATATISIVLLNLTSHIYTIYFHYKFGATLGKMAVGIKITCPDGKSISFKQALQRSSPDLSFNILLIIARFLAISNADFETYLNAGWLEREEYLMAFVPAWYNPVDIISQLWYWSEFIVLLFNKRKRALHDFIAGTVVIRQEYAEQSVTLTEHMDS